jgi:small subunit ribosomal protein S2
MADEQQKAGPEDQATPPPVSDAPAADPAPAATPEETPATAEPVPSEAQAVEAGAGEAGAGEAAPTGDGDGAMATAMESPVASGEYPIGLRALIDAGVHFGHQTKRWNPRMRPYIFGARNGIHIIDLDRTAELFKSAYRFIVDQVARGGHVLFIGTKRQAVDVIREEATRSEQFHVTGRWLGGTLTNFRTIKGSIDRLRDLERQEEDGSFDLLLKKEVVRLKREMDKLEKYLGGIKLMNGLPSVLFVIDPNHEHIAVREGRRLRIPIVALTDTNCDPELVDYVIPGNDDAIRSIRLVTSRVADAALEGLERRKAMMSQNPQAFGAAVPAGTNDGVPVEIRGRRGGRGPGRGAPGARPGQ